MDPVGLRNYFNTRMHSSRMRTGRLLTVCRSLLPGGWGVSALGGVCLGVSGPGGCLVPGGVCSGGCVSGLGGGGVCSGGVSGSTEVLLWGESAPRGSGPGGSAPGGVWSWRCVCSWGCLLQRCIPACTEADTTPLLTESQMPVKHYLGPISLRPVKIQLILNNEQG